MITKLLFTFLLCASVNLVFSQRTVPKDTQTIFTLGEVVVTGQKAQEINRSVGAVRMQHFARYDVSKALNLLPGISLSAVGPRNEAMVYVRGFDLRQVPVLIDGIPVYVPYDGYVDLARFTTFDLAEVQVSKGYTSVVYGPNALGGAINLISRKPVKPLEFNGASGWLSGGYRTNLNIGSRLGKFYFQGGMSRLRRDSFPLSGKFVPTKTEDGGSRNNSWNADEKYNVKLAYTPGKSEYAISYVYQHGKKGTPVYTGSDTLNSLFKNPRFWQWPYWDKRSLYFISSTVPDSSQYIKTRLYYDKFKNLLNSYDDATYTKISRPYAFKSHYDDYTLGGIAEYGKIFSQKENLKATLQYKQDVHREHNEGEPVRTMADQTLTAGLENTLNIGAGFTLLTGLSYNNRVSLKAQDYNSTTKQISRYASNSNGAWNVQGELQYKLDAANSLHLSAARKTRFATTKDRYSYRLGTAIPNPALEAEWATNYELGYSGSFQKKLHVQAALFYSRIHNTILMVSNVKYDSARRAWQSQLQNRGLSEYLGAEAGLEYQVLTSLKAGANYTWIRRNNLTTPTLYFIDVPAHKFFGFVHYNYRNKVTMQGSTEYNSKRFSTTYGTHTGGYALLNASASASVWKWFGVEAGINNIAGRNYSLAEGYPEPGRNYFANIVYHL